MPSKTGEVGAPLQAPANALLADRAALRPDEFAAKFGKGKMWAYRLIYKGLVRVIQNYGEFRIPISEVDRLTQEAQFYTGRLSRRGRMPKRNP